MEVFAKRIRAEREKLKQKDPKWTQDYVASLIDVARPTYTAYENGTKQPPMDTINKLADLFLVNTDYLLGRTDSPIKEPSVDIEEVDSEISMFFRDFKSAPKERQEEMLRFWKFIQEAEKGRKPGQRQRKGDNQ